MNSLPGESLTVCLVSGHDSVDRNFVKPSIVVWNNRQYKITRFGMHYTFKQGAKLFHVFCVSSDTVSFKVVLDTSSLLWNLEEVFDEVSG